MRGRFVTAMCAAIVLALGGGAAAQSAVAAKAVRARLERDGSVPAIVVLHEPPGSAGAEKRAALQAARARVLGAVRPDQIRVGHAFESVPAFSATLSGAALDALAAHPEVRAVALDGEGGGALAQSVPQIRADSVQRRGIQGGGVLVAVLDTGVDPEHPDLRDAIIGEECFCSGCCPDGSSRQSGPGSARSRHPHGVHVSGIALSRGRISAPGVAPQAGLFSVRVLNDSNRGFFSDWLAGLDWLAVHRPDIHVINMSLVSDALYPEACDDSDTITMLFSEVISRLYAQGTLVFAAAGNSGQAGAIGLPACIAQAVAVGAVARDDEVATFSNGGPQIDLYAPGVDIVSDVVGGRVGALSGTSMSAPHAAGAAALLLFADPNASPAQIEQALHDGGTLVLDRRNEIVRPRVSALGALNRIGERAPRLRGSGGEQTDCLLEWNFIPPEIGRNFPRPLATCRDNDILCDIEPSAGVCAFQLSLCFNVRDPLLPRCSVPESLLLYSLTWPPPGAPFGSIEERNISALRQVLPPFPVHGSLCTAPFRFLVPRPDADQPATSHIRLAVRSATRRDYDHVTLVCEPPDR